MMVESKNKSKLKINPQPYKSSFLAIPPSPFSPRTPLSLSPNPPSRRSKALPTPDASALPPSPLQWLWQCHQCRRTYSLGVTRRCLEDGHQFCAGATTVKTWRNSTRPGRARRHRACASEFDYQGWKTWGRWRRSGRRDSIYDEYYSSSSSSSSSLSSSASSREDYTGSEIEAGIKRSSPTDKTSVKDCWNRCDYPSECRWGKRFGVHTPIATEFPTIEVNPLPPPLPPSTASEGILKPENCKEVKKDKKVEKIDFWGALMASATRRKSVPPPSPLASISEGPEPSEPLKDGDGDVVMSTIDPALLAPHPSSSAPTSSSSVAAALTSSAPVATLKQIMRRNSFKRVTKASKSVDKQQQNKLGSKVVVSPPETMLNEFNFELEKMEDSLALDGFAPLERVASRDSGYHSNMDMS